MRVYAAILAIGLVGAPEAALAQVSNEGFGTTLSYSGPPRMPGEVAAVEAVVRNLTGAPVSAARAEIHASGAMSSFAGAGWSCAINLFIDGTPAPTSYICFYSGPAVPDGADFPPISFDVSVPSDGVTPISGAGAGAFQRLSSGVAYLPVTGIASFAGTIPTGPLSRLLSILIDHPVVSLEPRLGNSDGTVTAIPGNDVVTTVSLSNVSPTVTATGLPGLVIGGRPFAVPNSPFVPSVTGWTCSVVAGSIDPLWQCLAPSPLTLGPFTSVDVTLRLANASPAGTTVPDELWGSFEIAPVLEGVRGVRDFHSLRRSLRAVDDLFVLPSATAVLDVLANDPDPVGGGLTVLSAGPPLSGCAQIDVNPAPISYTPCGLPDEFTYTVEDSIGRSATAIARLVGVTSSSGSLISLAAVDPATVPPPPTGVTFPDGVFTFRLAVTPGETVNVEFTLPRPVTDYYKLDQGTWNLFCPSCGSGNVLTLTLTDGGYGDADGLADGVIIDPGAPAASALGSPIANDDAYATPRGVTLTVPAPGILENDADPEGGALRASLASGPVNGTLVLNADGSFGYTPKAGFSGGDSFTYTASDGTTASNVATVSITVAGNNPPVLANPGSQASAEGESILLGIVGIDPDGEPLTFGASGLPPGLGIDPTTGVVAGTIAYTAAAGSPYVVTVSVSDGMDQANASFRWTVGDTNRAPVITNPGPQSHLEGQNIGLAVAATDADDDVLVYGATGLPSGLAIDPATGVIGGTIGFDASPLSPYAVTVSVADGKGGTAEVSFPWAVGNTNRVPSLTNPGPQASAEGAAVTLTIEASDADGETLTFTARGLPPGLGIDPATGLVTGTIDYAASSPTPYAVTVFATDTSDATRDVSFNWTVVDTDRPPVLANPGDRTDAEGDTISLLVQAGDPDGDTLTFSATGLPEGLTVSAGGLVSGTLPFTAAGAYDVTIAVSDGSLTATQSFTWTVVDVPETGENQPPDCTRARPSAAVLPDNPQHLVPIDVLHVSDPDGDRVSIEIARILQDEPTNFGPHRELWIDGFGVGTPRASVRAERNGTSSRPGNGRLYEILFRATDGRGGACTGSVIVAVPWTRSHPAVDDGQRYDSTVPGGPRVP